MSHSRFRAAFCRPQYWFTWLGFGLWYLLAQLPYRWQLAMGRGLGRVLYRFAKRRCGIARRNLALCFPDWAPEAREALVKRNMEATGMAFFETGMGWFWPARRLDRIYQLEGAHHLAAVQASGQGAILLGFHWTHIDMGAKLMGRSLVMDGTYRPHNNAVYDFVQRWGRERLTQKAQAFARHEVRGMVKSLRRGRALWYAPDQDYGRKHSVFVDFFGLAAATITATANIAQMGNARVLPFVQTRLPGGRGYRIVIHPPLEDYPSGDSHSDARRLNAFLEAQIIEQPEQYLWVHRRFKTRPEGQESLYRSYRGSASSGLQGSEQHEASTTRDR